ncbi:UNVERIFIED_CONTAM: hypothetical protein HDU68_008228 [Siphonaria sp. JEL0065]|nr:hypothetical protein HDU68_008228 [Siphonaria sp. JEL0065]
MNIPIKVLDSSTYEGTVVHLRPSLKLVSVEAIELLVLYLKPKTILHACFVTMTGDVIEESLETTVQDLKNREGIILKYAAEDAEEDDSDECVFCKHGIHLMNRDEIKNKNKNRNRRKKDKKKERAGDTRLQTEASENSRVEELPEETATSSPSQLQYTSSSYASVVAGPPVVPESSSSSIIKDSSLLPTAPIFSPTTAKPALNCPENLVNNIPEKVKPETNVSNLVSEKLLGIETQPLPAVIATSEMDSTVPVTSSLPESSILQVPDQFSADADAQPQAVPQRGSVEVEELGADGANDSKDWVLRTKGRDVSLSDLMILVTQGQSELKKGMNEINHRFDGMEKRLEKRLDGMEKRLDGMDKRFDRIDKTLSNQHEAISRWQVIQTVEKYYSNWELLLPCNGKSLKLPTNKLSKCFVSHFDTTTQKLKELKNFDPKVAQPYSVECDMVLKCMMKDADGKRTYQSPTTTPVSSTEELNNLMEGHDPVTASRPFHHLVIGEFTRSGLANSLEQFNKSEERPSLMLVFKLLQLERCATALKDRYAASDDDKEFIKLAILASPSFSPLNDTNKVLSGFFAQYSAACPILKTLHERNAIWFLS